MLKNKPSSSELATTMNKNSPQEWPEPIVRVQSLSKICKGSIPERYIKPLSDRPSIITSSDDDSSNLPIIDLVGLYGDPDTRASTLRQISEACHEWGFFQVVNHGVSHDLMDMARETWRKFFDLPMEVKQQYANSPKTYEGYGSRLGVEKGATLDWKEEYLENALGGEDIGACLRVCFYPKCPQPELTLGLSSHSDPGGITLLLSDEHVYGLQVRKSNNWITVKPAPYAFIVNIGDQVQVLSNAIYKSVEHRVIVNSDKERVSLAFFYNPKSDIPIEPAKELVKPNTPALYTAMTFDEYRLFIRLRGPCGKSQVESLKSPT
ncbi:unnamed protein product [Lupinus luteus]|uniref:Fe2OG dioxygenase domain-containing protein n=1 Tax=Lupinus luteus TaxID=3873 RepID=A0AAV1WEI8_LUPLU